MVSGHSRKGHVTLKVDKCKGHRIYPQSILNARYSDQLDTLKPSSSLEGLNIPVVIPESVLSGIRLNLGLGTNGSCLPDDLQPKLIEASLVYLH